MRNYHIFIWTLASLLLTGADNARAEPASSYDLGDQYTLKLGSKAGNLYRSHNIIALKKSDVAAGDDVLVFTLNRPQDHFGGDVASLGVFYTKPLQENITSYFSLTGGPAGGGVGMQDVAMSFHIRIELP